MSYNFTNIAGVRPSAIKFVDHLKSRLSKYNVFETKEDLNFVGREDEFEGITKTLVDI